MDTPLQVLKSNLFRGLAHPTRIRILERLVIGPRTVQTLQPASPQLSVTRTSVRTSARL